MFRFSSPLFRPSGYLLISFFLTLFSMPFPTTYAQTHVTGEVLDERSGEPLFGAVVHYPEGDRGVVTDIHGSFELRNLPSGSHQLKISYLGYRDKQITIHTDNAGDSFQILLTPSDLELEGIIITSSPLGRNIQYQPAQAINRQVLQERAAPSLGEILDGSPGISMRSFGSAPARPVIRGLDGDRVVVLQNGERMGDLSSTAHDHAVGLDPLAIERVEIVRGPASLLYGSSALGGVVNLFTYDLPQEWSAGSSGSLVLHGATVNLLGSGLARGQYGTERVAVTGSLAYRNAGNVRTPDGVLPGTYLESYSFGSGFGYRNGNLQTGLAFTGMHYNYGLPEDLDQPDDRVEIGMDRMQIQSVSTLEMDHVLFEHAELRFNANNYYHEEIEFETVPGGWVDRELGLVFHQKSVNGTLTLRHRPFSRFEGVIGISSQVRDIRVSGEEILSPNATGFTAAAFIYEEYALSEYISLLAGSRLELQRMSLKENRLFDDISGFEEREDLIFSGSTGLNVRPGDRWEIGLQLARAYRTPTLEELYSDAAHVGAGAYEIGDSSLDNEISLGTDLFVSYSGVGTRMQLSAYLNRVNNFVMYTPTGDVHAPSGLPVFTYASSDVQIQGFEFLAEGRLGAALEAGFTLDYVRGSESDAERTPLPFMPPLRAGLTLKYNHMTWWAGPRLRLVSSQNRLAPAEETTRGYALLGFDAGYRFGSGVTLSLRLDNLLDTSYRDHLSRVTERDNPMPGRNLNASLRWDL